MLRQASPYARRAAFLTVAACAGIACAPPVGLDNDGAWARDAHNPLLTAGRHTEGKVERGIADPSVIFDPQANLWRLYYSTTIATTYADAEGDYRIFTAESPDGVAWTVLDAPALAPGASGWDHEHLETPSVLFNPDAPAERRFALYYAGSSTQNDAGFADYKIGLAFSADGRVFQRLPAAESPHGEDGLLLDERDLLTDDRVTDGVVADPDVVIFDGRIHLYASSFGCAGSCADAANIVAWGISGATSTDGIHFAPAAQNPLPSLQSKAGQQPSVAVVDDTLALWFTSDTDEEKAGVPSTFNPAVGFWKATSTDGETFALTSSSTRDFQWNRTRPEEEVGLLTGVEVVRHDDALWLYYTAWGTVGVPDGFAVFVRDALLPRPAVLSLLLATQSL